VNRSVQHRISIGLTALAIVASLVSGLVAFISAFHDAHEMQDDTLSQLAVYLVTAAPPGADLTTAIPIEEPASRLYIRWVQETSPGASPDELNNLSPGFHTREINHELMRISVVQNPKGSRLAVAQSVKIRDELAYDSAWQATFPLLVVLPLQILMVFMLTRRSFVPVNEIAKSLESRQGDDLCPFDTKNLPTEIKPFVDGINALLKRVESSIETQRQFVSNAAHELRSPLAAITLQIDRLSETELSEASRERVESLRSGVLRQRHLLTQLLDFSRSQHRFGEETSTCDLVTVVREVLEVLTPIAEEKNIDMGMLESDQAVALLSKTDAHLIIRNLIDNAIRYTPAGGQIDIQIKHQGHLAELMVRDTGPGIPAELRELVLQPFYRHAGQGIEGSGLGLSIVDSVVRRYNGKLTLSDSPAGQTGLTVSVRLPASE
jgi:two-component system OmpR family sensor kinase